MKKPSNFMKQPWDSVLQSSEAETVARNVMVILARGGDTWRTLSWAEYEQERQKDGSFSNSEERYFNLVVDYCSSPDKAEKFSSAWR